jgi:hypothetical protein
MLSRTASFVHSIEPSPELVANARAKFKNTPNVEIIQGLSEEALPALLPKLSGDLNFWLDGHYSGNFTFKGPLDTPVKEELAAIAANLSRPDRVTVPIDDIRDFTG